jgi:hypothetical protein
MENLRKKSQTEILQIKSPFTLTQKHSDRQRQIPKFKEKTEIKENMRRNLSQTTQQL